MATTKSILKIWCYAAFVLVFISEVAAASMKLVGETRLNVLFWPIYDAKLLTPDGRYSPRQPPIRLELTYLNDFSARSLVKQTNKEWSELGLDLPRRKEWLTELEGLWPDVKEGDSLTLLLDCSFNSHFFYNNQEIGSISDDEFGPSFLAIWLSESTSQPDMRKELLGQNRVLKSGRDFCG